MHASLNSSSRDAEKKGFHEIEKTQSNQSEAKKKWKKQRVTGLGIRHQWINRGDFGKIYSDDPAAVKPRGPRHLARHSHCQNESFFQELAGNSLVPRKWNLLVTWRFD